MKMANSEGKEMMQISAVDVFDGTPDVAGAYLQVAESR